MIVVFRIVKIIPARCTDSWDMSTICHKPPSLPTEVPATRHVEYIRLPIDKDDLEALKTKKRKRGVQKIRLSNKKGKKHKSTAQTADAEEEEEEDGDGFDEEEEEEGEGQDEITKHEQDELRSANLRTEIRRKLTSEPSRVLTEVNDLQRVRRGSFPCRTMTVTDMLYR